MNNQKKVRILSIDGGGMRGIIPATIIKYAEDYLQSKAPGTSIADHFDFIAGTSTGGILTCLYLMPDPQNPNKAKFSATDALNFYIKEGYNIFNGSKIGGMRRLWGLGNATNYSPSKMESLCYDKFGECKMSELIKPFLITTYNMVNKSSFFFTSNENRNNREFYVKDIARSTSAAPTYFPPAEISNIAPDAGIDGEIADMINLDGGVFANNPMLCAYAEVRKSNFPDRGIDKPMMKDMYILSLGTGGGGFSLKNVYNSSRWGLLTWATSIPDIMMDGSVDTVAYQMEKIKETLQPGDLGNYVRYNVPESKDVRTYSPDMADASLDNIKNLQYAATKTLENAKKNGLNDFLDGLID